MSAALAVPSYGAMALKPATDEQYREWQLSCSPLLRGDGPETIPFGQAARDIISCSPLLRGDGPETACTATS